MGENHYDDSAFTYFALSVLVVILVPSTYYYYQLWKDMNAIIKYTGYDKSEKSKAKAEKIQKAARKPTRWGIIKFALYVCSVLLFIWLLRHASQTAPASETVLFDPYKILEVDVGATPEEIKRSYRKLSLQYHPDKNPSEDASEKYIQIAKAYETLTDEAIREKWEKYGNPDGPQAFSVGIALPSWLVDTKNSTLVLLAYILFLVVVFPVVAICYWNRQKETAPNQVLKKTMYLFYQSVTENMRFKKLMEILSASFEYTDNLQIRKTDEIVLKKLQTDGHIPDVIDEQKAAAKKKKRVLTPFVIKHLMLFYGYFSRQESVLAAVEEDVVHLIKHVHQLVMGMVEISVGGGRRWLTPAIEAIQISQMATQAVWGPSARIGEDNSFLQLPHMKPDFQTKLAKKYKIHDILSFIHFAKRTQFLKDEGLTDEQIQDIDNVIAHMPFDVTMSLRCEVDEDDESVGITGGSIATLIAKFSRPSLLPNGMTKEDLEKEQAEKKTQSENAQFTKKKGNNEQFEDPFKAKIGKDEELIEAYAPYFPGRKNELWWLIIGDERTNRIVGLTRVNTLRHNTEAKVVFQAPFKPGVYDFTVYLLSDTYVGFDIKKPLKLTVSKEVPIKPVQEEEIIEDEETDENGKEDEQYSDEESVGSEDD